VSKKIKVVLVEPPGQLGYVPIASAYLVAFACQDPSITEYFNFSSNLRHFHDPFEEVLSEIIGDGVPDIVAFSCQGWSVRRADLLAQKLRQISPTITIVYGGNHVSHQADTFFQKHPYVNVLVNGEGEITFYEFLLSYLRTPEGPDLSQINGLSYLASSGHVITSGERERIKDPSIIPSPYLEGVLRVTRENCATALLETNRGCPYACSFCYWGGTIGQKILAFPMDRLKEEMLWLSKCQIDSWYICDANFGILPRDEELVDHAILLHEVYGFPKVLNTNWAKNSNQRIIAMCARLNHAGIHSAYSLSLQSTTSKAVQLANRANMKINRIEEIATLCREHDVVPRGELIWGLPGESYAEFLHSYDDLAEYTDSLHVYPHYLLPNTEYTTKADEYKIVGEQAELDTDYYYCVEHMSMTRNEFIKGLKFIVSNNIMKIGSVFFRLYPRVANKAAGIRYAHTIEAFGDWITESRHPLAPRFKKYYRFPLLTHRLSLGETWQALRDDREGLIDMFRCYVEETFLSRCDDSVSDMLRGAFEFDAVTYPVMDSLTEEDATPASFYTKQARFDWDYLALKRGNKWDSVPTRCFYSIRLPKGLWRYPINNWYIGLLSYEGRVQLSSAATDVPRDDPLPSLQSVQNGSSASSEVEADRLLVLRDAPEQAPKRSCQHGCQRSQDGLSIEERTMLVPQLDPGALRTFMEPLFSRCFSVGLTRAYSYVDRLCLHLCFHVAHECHLLEAGPESFGDLVARIGVSSDAVYMLTAVFDILTEEGFVARTVDGWERLRACPPDDSAALQQEARAYCPGALPTFEFIERCHDHAMAFLTGRVTGMSAVFQRGDLRLWERLHSCDEVMSIYADLVPPALEAILSERAHVLEVGAGVGSVIDRCLPLLRRRDAQEYCFTDIGSLFVHRAKKRYDAERFLRFMTVDLDRPLCSQGLETDSFDAVIAVNVLHSARDLKFTLRQLREVLKKPGWLICSEGSPPEDKRRWRLDIAFAFLRGWWDTHTDPFVRPRTGFLLPTEWEAALLAGGYKEVHLLPGKGRVPGPCRGGLIMARQELEVPAGRLSHKEARAVG
jgi:radical SAM superfamily enzyme YgiQ (UPF0313 family)/SAM-dependent methyltransferase